MDSTFDYDREIKILAAERDAISQLKVSIIAQEEELAQTMEYKRLQYMKEQLAVNESEAERHASDIKDHAIANFDGKNKRPHKEVGLGEYSIVSYNEEQMKQWAIEHKHPKLLNLNKKAANSVAKGATAPGFVRVSKEVRATISTDLSDYLS